jgi:hypothetical protein
VLAQQGGFLANVALVDDRSYEGLTPESVLDLFPAEYQHPLLVLADPVAVASTDLPLLVVDLRRERGRCVRVVAAELWSIENNLFGANMDFEEFAGTVAALADVVAPEFALADVDLDAVDAEDAAYAP